MDHDNEHAMAASQGYGGDPNVVTPPLTPWPLTLSRPQRQMIGVLSDIILPGTAAFPSPTAMGIEDFFDQWLSAPYDGQKKDNITVTTGLAMVDTESRRQFGAEFLKLDPAQQRKIVDHIASTAAADRKFFIRFRYLVVGAYFTSDVGFKAIGYLGNVPLRSFPAVSAQTQAVIDAELRKLGL